MSDPQVTQPLDRIEKRLDRIETILAGDPLDRDDGGMLRDMRDVKRFIRNVTRLGAVVGPILLTAGVSVIAARLFG